MPHPSRVETARRGYKNGLCLYCKRPREAHTTREGWKFHLLKLTMWYHGKYVLAKHMAKGHVKLRAMQRAKAIERRLAEMHRLVPHVVAVIGEEAARQACETFQDTIVCNDFARFPGWLRKRYPRG